MGVNTEILVFRIGRDWKDKREIGKLKPFFMPGEGQEIPLLQKDISKLQMMLYSAATWDGYRLHWDPDYSKRFGFPDVNVAGTMFGDYLTEMLVRWTGKVTLIKSLTYSNRAMAFPGDTLICRGKIREEYQEEGKRFAKCLVWVENQKNHMLVEGTAIVGLS